MNNKIIGRRVRMTVNLKSFFTLDNVEFTKEELELPYENTSKDRNQQNKICSKMEKTQNIMEMITNGKSRI